MNAARGARALQPRTQQGSSLLLSCTIHATDEGIFLARLAWRDPLAGKLLVQHGDKVMWQGGVDDVEHFAADVAANVQDKLEWIVS